MTNKSKIINDPVHGFISITHPLIFDIIEHPYFQRLRNIKQLAMGYMVYPGATHSRLQHALGAMHLLTTAIDVLRYKGHEITDEEAQATTAAILLHDIGHGPFSHALEHSLVQEIDHEAISRYFMQRMNEEMDGRLTMAIDIFDNKYPKHFLHHLISSQLDMDRMDYLKRDSFFTGVIEGAVGSDRIIKMLNVVDDDLVVEEKGIYSIEKFLIARRLMYWQVYLHKTVVAAEQVLIKMLQRAKEICATGGSIDAPPSLLFFLKNRITSQHFLHCTPHLVDDALTNFSRIDDTDIHVAAKLWASHRDPTLSLLANMVVNRRLPKVSLKNIPFDDNLIESIKTSFCKLNPNLVQNSHYFVFSNTVGIKAYQPGNESIKILYKSGQLVDIAEASDILSAKSLSDEVVKYFLCYPKTLRYME